MGPNFKIDFLKLYTCGFREQCTGSIEMKRRRKTKGLKRNPNIHLILSRTTKVKDYTQKLNPIFKVNLF